MRINWSHGLWKIRSMDGHLLHEAPEVYVHGSVAFVNADRGHKGYAVVSGEVTRCGDRLIITSDKES